MAERDYRHERVGRRMKVWGGRWDGRIGTVERAFAGPTGFCYWIRLEPKGRAAERVVSVFGVRELGATDQ